MITKWLKQNTIYPRARVAALSLVGSPRFYTPRTAAALCPFEDVEKARAALAADAVRLIRRERDLAIWGTPLGEVATVDTESAEHISFLVAEFERDVYLSGPVAVDRGMIVLDAGANIGMFTRQALSAGAQRVICLEPAPGNVRALKYNVAAELADGRVSIVEAGAWDTRATLTFVIDRARPGRTSCMEPGGESVDACRVQVPVLPIDAVIQELVLPRVDFVKMDIEGAELKALQGAAGVIERYGPQLAIAVEHTDDRLCNARNVRDLVLGINPKYRAVAGPYTITKDRRLAPEVLYFF